MHLPDSERDAPTRHLVTEDKPSPTQCAQILVATLWNGVGVSKERIVTNSNRARTRAIRERMAETGETYTQAAHVVAPDRPQAAPSDTGALGSILRTLLLENKAGRDKFLASAAKAEAEGRRLVGGGNDSRWWEITDWRTGEVIAQGDNGADEADATVNRLDPDRTWITVDNLYAETPDPAANRKSFPFVPDGVVIAIDEWLYGLSEDEVAKVAILTGWTDQQVSNCLKGPTDSPDETVG